MINKQEAIEKIKEMKIGGMFSDEVKKEALNIVSQIDEPQKVVIPKFVAEWIDYCKRKGKVIQTALNTEPDDVHNWLHDGLGDRSFNIFARAWLDGYEVEKEKLYFVRSNKGTSLLSHDNKGNVIESFGWNKTVQHSEIEKFGLTEQEIKDFDERYWEFRVSVEVE